MRLQGDRANQIAKLNGLRTIESRQALNESREEAISTQVTELQRQLVELPTKLENDQVAEIDLRNRVSTTEASELRAAQEKFRRELAAGLADPDTYAAGKITSQDPVTQVTISVVGVSRLQLRGPIKGINKIRRMIHQIDSPVGQVKIGIHTVQVNGEHGDRMDVVYERINREIAHSRFLVNQFTREFQQAVAQVATEVAMAVDQGYLPEGCPPQLARGDDQSTRDWRYVYSFFGTDFIDELRRMDSELINTDNKLLSLHSMDTISLAGALYVTSLADHPIRLRIVERFQQLIMTDLPEREVEYVKALTQLTPKGHPLIRRMRMARILDNREAKRIYFNADRTYRFPNTITIFNNQLSGQGSLNPVQHATIRMAQVLKAQLVAEMEYQNIVLERSLLEMREDETEEEFAKRQIEAREAATRAAAAVRVSEVALLDIVRDLKDRALSRLDTWINTKNARPPILKNTTPQQFQEAVALLNTRFALVQSSPEFWKAVNDLLLRGDTHIDQGIESLTSQLITAIVEGLGLTSVEINQLAIRTVIRVIAQDFLGNRSHLERGWVSNSSFHRWRFLRHLLHVAATNRTADF